MDAETAYLFRHTLLRDAAYQLHMPSARAALHELALAIIENHCAGDERALDAAAEELAQHARAAMAREDHDSPGLRYKHVAYLLRAFRRANSDYDRNKAARLLDELLGLEYCDTPTRCEALRERGDLARASAQGALALSLTKQSLELSQRHRLAEQAADAKYALSSLAMNTELTPAEAQLLQECEAEFGRLGLELKQLRATSRLFVHALQREFTPEARLKVAEMATRFRKLGSHRDASRLWVMYAMRLEDAGMLQDAIEVLAQAEPDVRSQGDAVALAVIEGRRGLCLKQLGDYDGALDCYSRAEQHNRRAGEQMGVAINVSNRGNIHYRRSDYSKALADYEMALAVAEESGVAAHRSSFAGAVANVLRELGNDAKAEQYYLRAIEIGRHPGAVRELTSALENLGGFLINSGRNQEGIAYLRAALELLPQNPRNRQPAIMAAVALGLLVAGNQVEAEALLEKSVGQFEAQNQQSSTNCAEAMAQLALLAHDRGERERALNWAGKLAAVHGKLDKIQLAGASDMAKRVADAMALLTSRG